MNRYLSASVWFPLLLLLPLIAFGCDKEHTDGTTDGDGGLETVRIGLVTWVGYGPFYIAREKGFFRDHGVQVELQRIEGDAERRAAIASGRLDGIALTLDAMIVLRSQNIPVQAVMAIDASNGGDGIVAKKEIKDVKGLKGRKVAFPSGLPSHFFLYSVLTSNGMKMSDIEPVTMDADKAGAAFKAGQVEVAVTWEPWVSVARETGFGHVLVDSKQHHGAIEDVLFMREEFIQGKPEAIQGIIKAWYQAVDFLEKNPEEANAIIAEAFSLSDEMVKELLPTAKIKGREQNQAAFGTADAPGGLFDLYDRISTAWLDEGVIDKRDLPADGIHPEFIRQL